MKNCIITLLLILLFTSFEYAQTQDKEKPTLSVVGNCTVTTQPDLCIITISASEVRIKMNEAVKALGEKSNYYSRLLTGIGFEAKAIKTTSFNANVNRVYRKGHDIDSGYFAKQNIKLEFEYNEDKLQKVIAEFSKSETPIIFTIKFELSEKLKTIVLEQIIKDAIKDANEKANTMAIAQGVKLLKLKNIKYGFGNRYSDIMGDVVERKNKYYKSVYRNNDNVLTNFSPEDIELKDVVAVEWFVE